MKILRRFLDAQQERFQSGGRLDRLFPLFEAVDTILYTPGKVTTGTTHVREALDLKRMMSVVVAALMPIVFFAMYNTGLQASRAIAAGAQPLELFAEHRVPRVEGEHLFEEGGSLGVSPAGGAETAQRLPRRQTRRVRRGRHGGQGRHVGRLAEDAQRLHGRQAQRGVLAVEQRADLRRRRSRWVLFYSGASGGRVYHGTHL